MASPPPLPTAPRILLSAAGGGLTALVGLGFSGPQVSAAITLPLLVACGLWLVQQRAAQLPPARRDRLAHRAPALLGLLLLIVPLTQRTWGGIQAFDATDFVDVTVAVPLLLTHARRGADGLPELLLGSGVALALAFGRPAARAAGLYVGAAAGSTASREGLYAAIEALYAGDASAAARFTLFLDYGGVLALIGGAIGAWLTRRPDPAPGAHLLTLAALAVVVVPPVREAVAGLDGTPPVLGDARVPHAAPGPTMALALTSLDDLEDNPRFAPRASQEWACARSHRGWPDKPRITALLALPPEADRAAIEEALGALHAVTVDRMALVGRAPAVAGPLGPWLGAPAVGLLLDRPPYETTWAHLSATLRWTDGAPSEPGACAILLEDGVTVDILYHEARALIDGGACTGVAVVPPAFRTTDDPKALRCPPARPRRRQRP